MSISNKKRLTEHSIRTYFLITIFCILFSVIYEHFSHGVYSGFMVFLFSIPFAGGFIPFFLINITSLPFPGKFASNAYHSGIAALTVGCCMHGIFEIYGSSSNLLTIYWIAGGILILTGLTAYLLSLHTARHTD